MSVFSSRLVRRSILKTVPPDGDVAAFDVHPRHLGRTALGRVAVERDHRAGLEGQVVRVEAEPRRRGNDGAVFELLFRPLGRGRRIFDRRRTRLVHRLMVDVAVGRDLEHPVEEDLHLPSELLADDGGDLLAAVDLLEEGAAAVAAGRRAACRPRGRRGCR